ncbi:MAG: trypsin-like peptidase domain-containing protein [Hyphomicrobiales bacterium]|nr:trypsin-like peptidase domain-containing protein [Hyphomicrobiales bacterium]
MNRSRHWKLALAAALLFARPAAAKDYASVADLSAAVMPSFVDIYNRSVEHASAADGMAPGKTVLIKDEVGSGFIVDPSGLIVTNRHVVEGAYSLFVTLSTGEHVPARLVGKALTFDIALIKIDVGRPLPVAKLGDSTKLRIGDRVVAIGNPLGFAGSVSAGVVSAFHRTVGLSAYDDLIQTDAAINQGNSGGPLFDMSGDVVGVNQAIYTRNKGGSIGIGFSIPINDVKFLVDNVLKYGSPRFGWLGVTAQNLTSEMAKAAGLPGASGVILSKIAPDSPAARAKLQVGDIILKVGDRAIEGTSALNRAVSHAANAVVEIELYRKGAKARVPVSIAEWPKEIWESKMEPVPSLNDYADFGVNFVDTPDGPTVKSVVEQSVAWTAGLREGDIVKSVGDVPVHTTGEMGGTIDEMFKKQAKTSALLLLGGPNGDRWVDVSIKE